MKIYERYPGWIVFLTNFFQYLGVLAGAYIMFVLHWITGVLFIIYVVIMELNVYREGCRYCYYYGKRCANGKGVLAKFFVKKGDPKKFCERELRWKDFAPMMLGVFIPVIVGILLLISRGFNIWILLAVIYPALNWFAINPFSYGKLSCAHCKQGAKCCPAKEFFDKM